MLDPKSITDALALLSDAVPTAARVRPEPRGSGGPEEGTMMRVKGPSGQSAPLHLVSWDEPPTSDVRGDRVWVIRRGGAKLRQRLRERGENYVDLSGAVRLQLPWLLVDRTDLEPVRVPRRSATRNPFSDRGSMVLRTMFEAGSAAQWGVKELAEASGVSVALSSYVTSAVERLGLIEAESSGRAKRMRLVRPTDAIELWARRYDWTRNPAVAFQAPVGSPERFVKRLPELLEGHRWALTGHAGAWLVAPLATWDRLHVYLDVNGDDGLYQVGQALRWTPGEKGKVVLMAPYYSTSVWHGMQKVQKLPVVSLLQLILDLWHYPVRGREQAEQLLSDFLSSRGWSG